MEWAGLDWTKVAVGCEAVGSLFQDRGQQATEIGLDSSQISVQETWSALAVPSLTLLSLLPFSSSAFCPPSSTSENHDNEQPVSLIVLFPADRIQLRYTIPVPPVQLPRGFLGGKDPFIILSPHSNDNNNKLRAEAGLSLGDAINPPILDIDDQYQFAAVLDSRIDKIAIFFVRQHLFHCTILYARQLAPTPSSNQSGH